MSKNPDTTGRGEDTLAEWSSTEELAVWLGVPVDTVYAWQTNGRGPRRARIGKYARYRRRDIEAWIADQYPEGA